MLRQLGLRSGTLGKAGYRCLSFYPAELVDVPPNSGAVVGKVRFHNNRVRRELNINLLSHRHTPGAARSRISVRRAAGWGGVGGQEIQLGRPSHCIAT